MGASARHRHLAQRQRCVDPGPGPPIHITGLDAPFALGIASDPEQYVWLEVDISALPATPTAIIDTGQDWNGGGAFFPSEVEFDTDDGTPTGSDDTPPDSRKQLTLYVPLARTYDITDNPFAPYDPPGYMLTDTIKLVQPREHQLAPPLLRLFPRQRRDSRHALARRDPGLSRPLLILILILNLNHARHS